MNIENKNDLYLGSKTRVITKYRKSITLSEKAIEKVNQSIGKKGSSFSNVIEQLILKKL